MDEIQRLLAIFAHPDDETYRASGAALSLLAQNDTQVGVLCATRGERGIAEMSPEDTGKVR